MRTSELASRAAYRLRRRLARHWITYSPMVAVRGRRADLRVRSTSSVCIEGYPRSGNTLALVSLVHANADLGHVASHLHAPAQVARSVHLGIPTCVIARPATDAVASLLMRGRAATPRELVEDHLAFHANVERHLDRLVVVAFDELVADPGVVSDALNRMFGLHLARFEDSPVAREQVERTVREMDIVDPEGRGAMTVALPTPERTAARLLVRERIIGEVPADLLRAADQCLARILGARR